MTNTTSPTRPTMSFPAICYAEETRTVSRPLPNDYLVQLSTWNGTIDHTRQVAEEGYDFTLFPEWSDGTCQVIELAPGESVTCYRRSDHPDGSQRTGLGYKLNRQGESSDHATTGWVRVTVAS